MPLTTTPRRIRGWESYCYVIESPITEKALPAPLRGLFCFAALYCDERDALPTA